MSLILLYILLAACICCICGLCIFMRRRERCRDCDGDALNVRIRHLVSTIDNAIGQTDDESLKKLLSEIRNNAAQLIPGVDVPVEPSVAKDEQVPQTTPAVVMPDLNTDIFDSLDDELVVKAVKYVESKMHNPDLSVEQLSEHFGVSRVHLYNKIKSATRLTPIEFIRIIRLRRGARMLRDGGMTVSEVASKVGFNSPRNFSKYFREEFGILPSAYQSQL